MSKSRAELQAERDRIQKGLDALQETANAIDAKLAELDAERKVWEPKKGDTYWYIGDDGLIRYIVATTDNGSPWRNRVLAANNCFPSRQAAERELLRRQSMKPTIPVPKVGDKVCLAIPTSQGWQTGYAFGWNGTPWEMVAYNMGRVKHTQEECQAWIDKFGHAWTTGDVA